MLPHPATSWLLVLAVSFAPSSALIAQESHDADRPANIQISIDATDLPRKLLHSTIEFPVSAVNDTRQDHQIELWYPKWVPGSHGPGGPIENVAGLLIENQQGKRLEWTRKAGEPYRILVEVPHGTHSLKVKIRYIANQPTTNSMGHDSFGSALLAVISPSSALLYSSNANMDLVTVAAMLQLPDGWQAASCCPECHQADRLASGFSPFLCELSSTVRSCAANITAHTTWLKPGINPIPKKQHQQTSRRTDCNYSAKQNRCSKSPMRSCQNSERW